MKLSPFVRYLEVMESLQEVHEKFFDNKIQHYRSYFLNRKWIQVCGYLDFVMAEYFGDEIEVEIEIDEVAGVYRYQNPQRRHHTLVEPISDISIYRLEPQRWFDDLGACFGIERKPRLREIIADHLWYLGETFVQSRIVQLFVARSARSEMNARIQAKLNDRVDPGQAVLLVDKVEDLSVFGEHIVRCLSDLIDFDGEESVFNDLVLARTLKHHTFAEAIKPDEYLKGHLLKLTHMPEPIKLSAEQIKIVSNAWGNPDKDPPVVSWNEVNANAKTGYVSFDDAFGSPERRDDVFARVSRGKYCLWRGSNRKTINKTINGAINLP